jgi:hypothetical protein
MKRSQGARYAEMGGRVLDNKHAMSDQNFLQTQKCCGEETNCQCTSLQAVYTTHPSTNLVENLHRNDGSQSVHVDQICEAQFHAHGRK